MSVIMDVLITSFFQVVVFRVIHILKYQLMVNPSSLLYIGSYLMIVIHYLERSLNSTQCFQATAC